MADLVAAEGWVDAGYRIISIDDCWEAPRNSTNRLSGDPLRFPHGMKALGDHIHSRGLMFGIYTDEGSRTCGGFAGSEGYEKIDADTFAAWGVDYLKLDGCNNNKTGYQQGYPAMGAALQATGRNIVYSCSWPA